MKPLNIPELKQTSKDLLLSCKRSSGLVAAFFMLVTNLLIFAATFPIFCKMQEYDASAAVLPDEPLMLSLLSDAISVLISFCFSAVFSAYCLKFLRGAPSDGKTLMKSFSAVPQALILIAAMAIFAAAAAFLYSYISLIDPMVGTLVLSVCTVLALVLYYIFRLCFFALADQKGFHPFRAMKECAQLTSGHKKDLFFLDLSFIWFSLLTGIVFFVFSAIPDALLILAESTGRAVMAEWISTNYLLLSVICSVAGYAAGMPLYYHFFTRIQLTFALAYQSLKRHLPKRKDTQPLAYMEFDPPQDDAT